MLSEIVPHRRANSAAATRRQPGAGGPFFDKCILHLKVRPSHPPEEIRLGGRLRLGRRRRGSLLGWETWEPFWAGCKSRGNCTAGIVQWGRGGGPRRKRGRPPPRQLFPSNFPAAPSERSRNWGLPFALGDSVPPPPGGAKKSASLPPSLSWGGAEPSAVPVTHARRLMGTPQAVVRLTYTLLLVSLLSQGTG